MVLAHPDDAEFLCAATVAKLCFEGWEVNYLLTTSGDMGTHDESMTREALAPIREKEQRAAAKVLGVKEVVFLRYPDGFFEDTAEARGRIVYEIRRLRPDTVITWDPFRSSFTHRDHRLTGQAALDAIFQPGDWFGGTASHSRIRPATPAEKVVLRSSSHRVGFRNQFLQVAGRGR